MTDCLPQVVDLCRTCRIHISWPVTGVDATNQAKASLDAGPWVDLAIAPDLASVIGYFAGPDFVTPGAATAVARTAHFIVKIPTTTESLIFEGGFIRLVP